METIVKTNIGAYGVIIHEEEIALVKKSRGAYKGKLDLPGGRIEHEEDPIKALKREVSEEAGVTLKGIKILDAYSKNVVWLVDDNTIEDLQQIGIIYTCDAKTLILKHSPDKDSDGADWYPIKDLNKDNLTPIAKHGLEKLGYKFDK